ncbi:MAG: hypothetical protein PHU49_14575 [Syntrophorhabdaceae bacterium]|nr:hypothetical protein [Syntrophorhabdaceae bacterium]
MKRYQPILDFIEDECRAEMEPYTTGDYVLYSDAEAALKEKDDLLNVYQNTPFAHWHERALRAEEQIAALKAEIEQWKRVVVTHVEEIERLKEARTS